MKARKKILAMFMAAVLFLSAIPVAAAQSDAGEEKILYTFDLEDYLREIPTSKIRYDYMKLATALQGLANRTEPQLWLFAPQGDEAINAGWNMDTYWLTELRQDDGFLSGYTIQPVADFWQLFTIFEDCYNGIVLWDESVPATANVASTIAGVENLLPVRYATGEKDVYTLMQQHGLAALVVGEKDGPRIHSEAGSFAYHPSMAVLRLQQLKRGQTDHLLPALGLHEGVRVLDATMGLAADAALSAYAVGEGGRVVGLEASPLLHFAVSYGLAHYVAEDEDLTAALRRIEPVQAVAKEYLAQCAAQSFDVVYFDPMFRHPVQGSNAMDALRPLSYEATLDEETLALARRAAARVVIKERSEYILRQYGCTEFIGGKYSRIKYGILA